MLSLQNYKRHQDKKSPGENRGPAVNTKAVSLP